MRREFENDFDGKILVLDVNSGDYEIDETTLPAVDRLKARHADAECYIMRINYKVVYGFGSTTVNRDPISTAQSHFTVYCGAATDFIALCQERNVPWNWGFQT